MNRRSIYDVADERVLLLDGGFGTMLMHGFTPREIHEAYLRAGADIIETDIAASDHASALAAACTAREAAQRHTEIDPLKPRFAFGAVYPSENNVAEHVEGLLDGGIDGIVFETATAVEPLVASLETMKKATARRGISVPVIVSATLTREGRLPSGESVADFYTAVAEFKPFAAGFNCSYGPESLMKPLAELDAISDLRIVAYPGAGMPDNTGKYPVESEAFAACVEQYIKRGLVDIIGGCCGTTPEYIAALGRMAKKYAPRRQKKRING